MVGLMCESRREKQPSRAAFSILLQFARAYPQYKSIAHFVHEAVRIRMEEVRKSYAEKPLPRFEHFNRGPNGVKITDRQLHRIPDVDFKPEGIFCELCQKNRCEHIAFAYSVPEIKSIIDEKQKEGG
jgi:hypothetical protein